MPSKIARLYHRSLEATLLRDLGFELNDVEWAPRSSIECNNLNSKTCRAALLGTMPHVNEANTHPARNSNLTSLSLFDMFECPLRTAIFLRFYLGFLTSIRLLQLPINTAIRLLRVPVHLFRPLSMSRRDLSNSINQGGESDYQVSR